MYSIVQGEHVVKISVSYKISCVLEMHDRLDHARVASVALYIPSCQRLDAAVNFAWRLIRHTRAGRAANEPWRVIRHVLLQRFRDACVGSSIATGASPASLPPGPHVPCRWVAFVSITSVSSLAYVWVFRFTETQHKVPDTWASWHPRW